MNFVAHLSAKRAKIPIHTTAWLSFFLLGAGILAPWSAFITASDYFGYLYSDRHVDRSIAIVYFIVNLVTLVALLVKGDAWHERTRIVAGYIGFTIALISIPLIDLIMIRDKERGTNASFAATLLVCGLTGFSDAISQGSLFGATSRISRRYSQALMIGTSASAVLIGLLRIVTKAACARTIQGLRISSSIYFITAGILCLACVYVYEKVLPPAIAAHHSNQNSNNHAADSQPSSAAPSRSVSPIPEEKETTTTNAASTSSLRVVELAERGNASMSETDALLPSPPPPPPPPPPPTITNTDPPPFIIPSSIHPPAVLVHPISIVKRLWRLLFGIMLNFTITLSIFPGVLTEDIRLESLGDWYGVMLIFTFNVFDFVGKMVPMAHRSVLQRTLFNVSLSRLAFLPLFFIASRAGARPLVMGALTATFGASNGWIATEAFSMVPKLVARPRSRELAGLLIVLFLLSGLTLGAMLGWLWVL